MGKKIIVFIALFYFTCVLSHAQNNTVQKKDSAEFYKKLEKYSGKTIVGKLIYDVVFKPFESVKKPKRERAQLLRRYEGKIIRNINVNVIDPFGYDINDTSVTAHTIVSKVANTLHVSTRQSAIKSQLMFRPGQVFDSLYVKESARILRSLKFIREVKFRYAIPRNIPDSVDIYVNVLDNWSIIPGAFFRPNYREIKATDYNFLGLGHQFSGTLKQEPPLKRPGFESSYLIPSIRSTHISLFLQVGYNVNRSYLRQISLERTYFSPLVNWAGGFAYKQQLDKDTIIYPDNSPVWQNFRYNTFDTWVSKAWPLFPLTRGPGRTTKIITSARYLRTTYLDRPLETYDSLGVYTSENFYMTGIGISTRQYIEDTYIFNYGLTEDVPIGRLWELIVGYQLKNKVTRGYTGLRFSKGGYYFWGYFSSTLQYGTFFSTKGLSQGVILTGADYFTYLLTIGNWRFRQFVKSSVMIGLNRLATDKVYLKEESGLKGFENPDLFGQHKILISLQSQFYAPWHFLGFRFGPYLTYSMGLLAGNEPRFRFGRPYSQFGIGILIKNEFLQTRIFQISLAYYPYIPGSGKNIAKLNAYKTTDFGFRYFDMGKPLPISYQ